MAVDSDIKRIVCFANSRKMAGRCVAGKEVSDDNLPGGWVRPVSDREHESVSEQERQYSGGNEPQILDIVDVPLLNFHPKDYQQENWRLDPARRWVKVGNITWAELAQFEDAAAPLWINGCSSRNGYNDCVPESDAVSLTDSLRLIRVGGLTVTVSEPSRPSANYPILRGRFNYFGEDYCFRITDPESESGSLSLPYGEYHVGERYLTVSLGEPFEGNAYKLIATIVKP